MSIIASDLSFHYPNQQPLFERVSFSVQQGQKVSVIGSNGVGKSTLLKLLSGTLLPATGSIHCATPPCYIPQQTGTRELRVGDMLGVAPKIEALQAICEGSCEQHYFDVLAEDWEVESRCAQAFEYWDLSHIELNAPFDLLSGGEKTKILLAGILVNQPEIILLDEPTNHLDIAGREKLYRFIEECRATVVVVSHDITLLNLLSITYELSNQGVKLYGGCYDFYREQKEVERMALEQQIKSEMVSLRMAKRKAQEVHERQEKREQQGERNKSQIIRILRKTMLNKGENSGAKLRERHSGIVADGQQRLSELRQRREDDCVLKIDFKDAALHRGKLLIDATNIQFEYIEGKSVWETPLTLEVRSGERIHLRGNNSSGKTTLIRLLTGELTPSVGVIKRSDFSFVYLDQEYRQVNTSETVLSFAQRHNRCNLQDHEVKLRLHRALFPKECWDKCCTALSGGERMRLYLCSLMISNDMPDLFILDEPTNNLDLSSLLILTAAIKTYQGTLIIVSHDYNFVEEVGVTRVVELL